MIPLDLTPEEKQVIRQRFLAKVEQGPDCWTWKGVAQTRGGRGRMRIKNRVYYAYRVAYALEHGSLPANLGICHRCDNPACVRPDHLFAGTQADNVTDMDRKGRRKNSPRYGRDHHKVTTTDDQVAWAIAMYRSGRMTQTLIGQILGVKQQTVSGWVHGQVRSTTAKGRLIAAKRNAARTQRKAA
ncbi:HNH endonuclease signature motif containing protein [Streptomyces chartreusis]|uniref:HNH endonuclease signature motif containing protein n=1 Tax=Streptomyces chartreusis TaxID=1969 RepID=UPI00368F0769